MQAEALSRVCRVVGALLLEGYRADLYRSPATQHGLAAAVQLPNKDLVASLQRLARALAGTDPTAAAAEYTRLFVANGVAGPRARIPVAPWEDCHLGGDRQVLGERSRAVLKAYAAARLGFDGMREQPADHIGLEVLFVAALLEQEVRQERDAEARRSFVRDHLGPFAHAFGTALIGEARDDLWRCVGQTVAELPAAILD